MKLVEVCEGTLFEAQMVKNLSDNEGIESSLMDELQAPGGGGIWRPAGGVKVVVGDLDYEKARIIVGEYESPAKKINWYWKQKQ